MMNFVVGWWQSTVRFRGEKESSRPLGALSTRRGACCRWGRPGGVQHASTCVARHVAARDAARPRRPAVHPPLLEHYSRVYPLPSFFLNYFTILNKSQILAKTKIPQNFELYKFYLRTRSQFWVEEDQFEENSSKFKIPILGNSNLNWGRIEIPKLLLIFLNNLKNSQNKSCSFWWALQLSFWSLFKIPARFWIRDSNCKRGQFLEIYFFQKYFEFCIETSKLKTPKLYILSISTTLLLNSSPNFA